MPFCFKVSYSGKSANIMMNKEKIFVGRASTCQIQLKDPLISNCHCLITIVDDHLVIKDLGSTNGVIINGTKVQESKIHIGDIIKLGKTNIQLVSSQLTPEQTRIHTNKELGKANIGEISFDPSISEHDQGTGSSFDHPSPIKEPVSINFPDDDED